MVHLEQSPSRFGIAALAATATMVLPRIKRWLGDCKLHLLARNRPAAMPVPEVAYRLRAWPSLRDSLRTAAVLRALTRMELGPVTERWFIGACRLQPREGALLLTNLVQHGYVQQLNLRRGDGGQHQH